MDFLQNSFLINIVYGKGIISRGIMYLISKNPAEHHHLINYKMTFGKTATIFTWCILYLTAIFKMNALYHGI